MSVLLVIRRALVSFAVLASACSSDVATSADDVGEIRASLDHGLAALMSPTLDEAAVEADTYPPCRAEFGPADYAEAVRRGKAVQSLAAGRPVLNDKVQVRKLVKAVSVEVRYELVVGSVRTDSGWQTHRFLEGRWWFDSCGASS